MDDMLYPSYKSPKIRSHNTTFNDGKLNFYFLLTHVSR